MVDLARGCPRPQAASVCMCSGVSGGQPWLGFHLAVRMSVWSARVSCLVGLGCFRWWRILDGVTEGPSASSEESVREPAGTSRADADAGDGDWLAQVAGDLRRLQRRLGPDFGSLGQAGQRAVGDVARASVPAWRRLTRGEPRWPVSVAVLVMIVLQLRLPGDLTPIGRWLLPAIELVVLAVLVVANPRRIDRGSPMLRGLGLGLIGVASLANAWSVALLIDDLVHGSNGDDPVPLLATGANIWITNVIIFALWYWELDRGGPAAVQFPVPQREDDDVGDPDVRAGGQQRYRVVPIRAVHQVVDQQHHR